MTSRTAPTDDIARAILLAPLQAPTAKWSSRSVAEDLGVSQSRVARAWAPLRTPTAVSRRLDALLGTAPVELAGVLVTAAYSLLVLRVAPSTARSGTAFASPATRRAYRALLAAELARDRIPEPGSVSGRPAAETFWRALAAGATEGARYAVVASAAAPVPGVVGEVTVCEDEREWLSVFTVLGGPRRQRRAELAQAVESALREWFPAPAGDFAWLADADSVPGVETAGAFRPQGRIPPDRALADDVLSTIRAGIADGRFVAGNLVTERHLATRLHTTRAQVRSALRLLEHDGLLTVTGGHSAVVPVPEAADVAEIYAARQALGTMMIRAAVRWTPPGRASVEAALEEVHRHAAAGDRYLTGQADTAFQDRLGEASGLVRIAPVMHSLADHLRILIAVMGVDYAYPIEDIVRDDDAIFAALDAGDTDRAVTLWRAKMSDARAYMIERIGRTPPRRTHSRTRSG